MMPPRRRSARHWEGRPRRALARSRARCGSRSSPRSSRSPRARAASPGRPRVVVRGVSGRRFAARSRRHLGPGASAWPIPAASAPGSSSGLDRAARAFEALPGRDCLLVVRDGALVHESYFGGAGRDALVATDDVGLLAVAALVGAGERANLFSLDAPLAAYGVDTARLFGATHGAVVTARHVLAQVHGGGVRPPGVAFARDDRPVFLSLLVELLEKTTGAPRPAFAAPRRGKDRRAELLRTVSHLRRRRLPGDAAADARRRRSDISASGRYYATCGEMAKVAQIFLNLGEWPGGDRIVSAPSSRSRSGRRSRASTPRARSRGRGRTRARGGVPRGGAAGGCQGGCRGRRPGGGVW